MTSTELLADYDMEMEMTRKILARVPNENPDYKPHEKSMAMGRLAMHIATLPYFARTIATTPSLDMANSSLPHPDMTFRTSEIAVAAFDTNAAEARKAVEACTEEDLAATWKFSFGDFVISNGPRSLAFRHLFLNHLIHHRAQLGVYLRLNGVAVPGVYGPSADEPFQA